MVYLCEAKKLMVKSEAAQENVKSKLISIAHLKQPQVTKVLDRRLQCNHCIIKLINISK